MSFFSELEDVTREAISTFGKDSAGAQLTLVYEGVTIDCFEEDSEETRMLMDGGAMSGVDLIVRALLADFPKRPKAIETLMVNGVTRKVHKVYGSQGDPEIRLALQTVNQRK